MTGMNTTLKETFNEEIYAIPGIVQIVLKDPWESYSDQQRELLAKIVSSIKLSMSGVRITSSTESYSTASHIILFDASALPDVPPYKVVMHNSIPIIKADNLDQLDENRKKSLWLALKEMFRV